MYFTLPNCLKSSSSWAERSSVADDTQLYLILSVLSDDASVAVEHLDAYLVDVKAWLRATP